MYRVYHPVLQERFGVDYLVNPIDKNLTRKHAHINQLFLPNDLTPVIIRSFDSFLRPLGYKLSYEYNPHWSRHYGGLQIYLYKNLFLSLKLHGIHLQGVQSSYPLEENQFEEKVAQAEEALTHYRECKRLMEAITGPTHVSVPSCMHHLKERLVKLIEEDAFTDDAGQNALLAMKHLQLPNYGITYVNALLTAPGTDLRDYVQEKGRKYEGTVLQPLFHYLSLEELNDITLQPMEF